MKKCSECEHFEIQYPPMGFYDSGMAKCEKHDLVVDYFGKQKLNKLTCVEEDFEMQKKAYKLFVEKLENE